MSGTVPGKLQLALSLAGGARGGLADGMLREVYRMSKSPGWVSAFPVTGWGGIARGRGLT